MEIKEILKNIGMEITSEGIMLEGTEAFKAEIETKSGKLYVTCTDEFLPTARVDKPNGTHKWLYQKTRAQLRRAVEQAIEYYGRA